MIFCRFDFILNAGAFVALLMVFVIFRNLIRSRQRRSMEKMQRFLSGGAPHTPYSSVPPILTRAVVTPPPTPWMNPAIAPSQCPRCTAVLPGIASFCPRCGAAFLQAAPPPLPMRQFAGTSRTNKSYTVYFVIAVLAAIGLSAYLSGARSARSINPVHDGRIRPIPYSTPSNR